MEEEKVVEADASGVSAAEEKPTGAGDKSHDDGGEEQEKAAVKRDISFKMGGKGRRRSLEALQAKLASGHETFITQLANGADFNVIRAGV